MSDEQAEPVVDMVRWTFSVDLDHRSAIEAHLRDLGLDVFVEGEGRFHVSWDEPDRDMDEVIEELWAIHGHPFDVTQEEFHRVSLMLPPAGRCRRRTRRRVNQCFRGVVAQALHRVEDPGMAPRVCGWRIPQRNAEPMSARSDRFRNHRRSPPGSNPRGERDEPERDQPEQPSQSLRGPAVIPRLRVPVVERDHRHGQDERDPRDHTPSPSSPRGTTGKSPAAKTRRSASVRIRRGDLSTCVLSRFFWIPGFC